MAKTKMMRLTALLMSALVSLSGFVSAETASTENTLFSDDFEAYESAQYFGMIWNTDALGTGNLSRDETSQYITNSEGRNCIIIAEEAAKAADARLSVDLSVETWEAGASAALYLCLDDYVDVTTADGYRMVLDAAENKARMEKLTDGVPTELDAVDFSISAKTEYTLALSVKAGMLRGEIDGTVWLIAFDAAPLAAGYAGIETTHQEATLTNAILSGEDRLFYDNFDSGRNFVGLGGVTKSSSGTVTVSNGKMVLGADENDKYPELFVMRNPNSKGSSAWQNTKVTFEGKLEGDDPQLYISTHSSNWDARYRGGLHNAVMKYSAFYINNTKSTAVLTDSTNSLSIKNVECDYEATTKTESDKVSLEYKVNNTTVMTAEDAAKTNIAGGVEVTPTKGTLTMDNLVIVDLNAEKGASDILFRGTFDDYTEAGEVVGESKSINNGTSVRAEAGNNGVLILRDRTYRNLDASVDVKADGLASGASAGMYIRYVDESNNLFFGLNSGGLVLTETVNGTKTNIATGSYSVSAGLTYRIRLEAKDGAYRGYIGDEMIINTTADTTGRVMSGSFGVGGVDAAASFDNIEIYAENYDWQIASEETGATLNFTPSYTTSDHTRLNAEMLVTSFDPATQGAFQLTSRMSGGKAYTAHIYASAESLKTNIISPDWSATFASNIDLGSKVNLEEYNKFGLETETLEDGSVKISIYVNDELVQSVTESEQKFIPENGHKGYQVKTRYSNTSPIVPARNIVLEDLNFDGKISASITADGDTATVKANNKSFEGKNLGVLTLTYSSKGKLTGINITPIILKSGEEATETVALPSLPAGGRVKIMCIDSFENMNLMCDSLEIK